MSGVNISARAAEVHFHPRFGAFVAGVCSLGFMRITFTFLQLRSLWMSRNQPLPSGKRLQFAIEAMA